ncbi:MAG: hypothetical protein JW922_09630 [Paludibacteraceae bacterium]|nr:hypothetical protein [Paludibacteraceae bacterium]
MTRLIIILTFILQATLLSAQDSTYTANLLEQSMMQKRNNSKVLMHKEIEKIANENPLLLCNALKNYTDDESQRVKLYVIDLLELIAKKHKKDQVRQCVADNLILMSVNSEYGISSIALDVLYAFDKKSFSQPTIEQIDKLLEKSNPAFEKLVMLAGKTEDTRFITKLKSFEEDSTIRQISQRWSIWLALCRLGDESSCDLLLKQVEPLDINDNFTQVIVPDLLYTKNKKIYDFVISLLYSEEKKCYSPNPDLSEKISCCYLIVAKLASHIKNFPIEVSSSGDLKTQNYNEALGTAREWFKDKNGKYKIID